MEVIVVIDGEDNATRLELDEIGDSRVKPYTLDRNRGPAFARNTGVALATGEWVAFLDDDDEWLPEKLAKQLGDAGRMPDSHHTVFATGVEWRTDGVSKFWPIRSPRPGESIADYLFVRREPGEGLVTTSSVMLATQLAQEHPFPVNLRLHEDYDLFLDLETAGSQLHVNLETLVVYHAPRLRKSLSSSASWRTSLDWARSRRSVMSPRAFAGFCLTEVARSAKRDGSIVGLAATLLASFSGQPTPFSLARFAAICFASDRLRALAANRSRKTTPTSA